MDFKDRIKKLRQEKGMTFEEVAKKVGVSASTIQRYESGNIKNVRRDKIAKLAEALDTSPSYLMGWDWDVVNMVLSDMEANVINAYRDNPDKQRPINKYLGVWDNPLPEETSQEFEVKMNEFAIKYAALTPSGKTMVDTVLNMEYNRTHSNEIVEQDNSALELDNKSNRKAYEFSLSGLNKSARGETASDVKGTLNVPFEEALKQDLKKAIKSDDEI